MDIRKIIQENPVLAIMRNIPLEKTIHYVEAIVEGGVRFFEVALNSKDALTQIRMMREFFKEEIYVGAGTAINVGKAKAAIEAGAQFLLSPSTDEEVLAYCKDNQITLLPGVLTPSDVSKCISYGFSTLKLFPAGDMKSGYIKSLKGPLDETEYIAIGGINPDNIQKFLNEGYIGVGLGSSLLPKDIIVEENWEKGAIYIDGLMKKIKGVID